MTDRRIIIGVDLDDEYRKLVGRGALASDRECTDHIEALIIKDKERMKALDAWACPKCGATADGHARAKGACIRPEAISGTCVGFLCECEDESGDDDHGTPANPCPNARCYHCDWVGKFPKKAAKKKDNKE